MQFYLSLNNMPFSSQTGLCFAASNRPEMNVLDSRDASPLLHCYAPWRWVAAYSSKDYKSRFVRLAQFTLVNAAIYIKIDCFVALYSLDYSYYTSMIASHPHLTLIHGNLFRDTSVAIKGRNRPVVISWLPIKAYQRRVLISRRCRPYTSDLPTTSGSDVLPRLSGVHKFIFGLWNRT